PDPCHPSAGSSSHWPSRYKKGNLKGGSRANDAAASRAVPFRQTNSSKNKTHGFRSSWPGRLAFGKPQLLPGRNNQAKKAHAADSDFQIAGGRHGHLSTR